MPLLHLALDSRDENRVLNQWTLTISHQIASQILTLKEAYIHTTSADPIGVVDVLKPGSSTGRTSLFFQIEQGKAHCLADRQIVSNFKSGSWWCIPCDYSAGRTLVQHYTGLSQAVALGKRGLNHDIVVTVYSDESTTGTTAPNFTPNPSLADDRIDKIDLIFEYDDFVTDADK